MSVILVVVVLASLASIEAFQGMNHAALGRRTVTMQVSSEYLQKTFKAAVGALSLTALLSSSPVLAARYEVIDPQAAVLNVDTKDSQEVKEGREAVNALIATVAGIKADLAKDGQIDLSKRITDELSIAKARIAFNKFNTAFDEDTQRGTDRLIRNIIQDVTELQREALVKEGKQRSNVKIANVEKRLNAAEDALKELAAFYH
eukprot:gene7944-8764_t